MMSLNFEFGQTCQTRSYAIFGPGVGATRDCPACSRMARRSFAADIILMHYHVRPNHLHGSESLQNLQQRAHHWSCQVQFQCPRHQRGRVLREVVIVPAAVCPASLLGLVFVQHAVVPWLHVRRLIGDSFNQGLAAVNLKRALSSQPNKTLWRQRLARLAPCAA